MLFWQTISLLLSFAVPRFFQKPKAGETAFCWVGLGKLLNGRIKPFPVVNSRLKCGIEVFGTLLFRIIAFYGVLRLSSLIH